MTPLANPSPTEAQMDSMAVALGRSQADLCAAPLSPGELAAAKVMVVDDQALNVKIAQKQLRDDGFRRICSTTDPRQAMEMIRTEQPDLLLLDIMMPYISGLELLAQIRDDAMFRELPVIVLTAAIEESTKLEALRLGATEFLPKPVHPAELTLRVRNVLAARAYHQRLKQRAWDLEAEVAQRSAELLCAYREVVQCLARVSEFRDNETGWHIARVGRYAETVALELSLPREFAARLRDCAQLHDIGKIGVPDQILLKPGRLEPEEFEVIKRHCQDGLAMCTRLPTGGESRCPASIEAARELALANSQSPLLQMAAMIALTHHERWDGAGYPLGLRGEAIPIESRITTVADVFDALTQRRSYKPPLPLDDSFRIIQEAAGKHFDPKVVEAFLAARAQIVAVFNEFGEPPCA